MIESVLYLLKVDRKTIFGNTTVIIQNVFGKTPKSFNAIDMIFATVGEYLAMIQVVMLAQPL